MINRKISFLFCIIHLDNKSAIQTCYFQNTLKVYFLVLVSIKNSNIYYKQLLFYLILCKNLKIYSQIKNLKVFLVLLYISYIGTFKW